MRYDILLRVGYAYAGPASAARHVLRVRPRGDRGQIVEHLAITADPAPSERATELDFFGNALDRMGIGAAHEGLSIEMRTRVRVKRGPAREAGTSLGDIAASARDCRDPDGASPIHHLGPSRLVDAVAAVTDYARAAIGDADRNARDAVLDLARAIRRDFAYEAGTTAVSTRVADVFRARRGVCQDFAHLMIAGLRGLGVPAAYASGYLRTDPPPGMARIEGADAMHAWVDVWLGETAGWVGFDPTNGCLAEDGHVIAALGRDYADVAPIDGVLLSQGPQSTWHTVDILPIEGVEVTD